MTEPSKINPTGELWMSPRQQEQDELRGHIVGLECYDTAAEAGPDAVLVGVDPAWREFGRAILGAAEIPRVSIMACQIEEIIKQFATLTVEAR